MNKKFLHVGCGPATKSSLKGFGDWEEIRFDIDVNARPDIVGTLTDMRAVDSESMDSLYSSHNIEHLYAHEVPVAMSEFFRVLKSDGFVVITCPDLQSVCKEVATGKLLEPLYISTAGPISAIDILYGHRGYVAEGNAYMAHKTGFTFPILSSLLYEAGFKCTYGAARPQAYDIWIIASKKNLSDNEKNNIAMEFLP